MVAFAWAIHQTSSHLPLPVLDHARHAIWAFEVVDTERREAPVYGEHIVQQLLTGLTAESGC